MAKTTEQLLQQAVQIRDEQANKKNTALRVGTLFSDIIEKQEESDQTHASDVTKINESINENKEKLTELASKTVYNTYIDITTIKDGTLITEEQQKELERIFAATVPVYLQNVGFYEKTTNGLWTKTLVLRKESATYIADVTSTIWSIVVIKTDKELNGESYNPIANAPVQQAITSLSRKVDTQLPAIEEAKNEAIESINQNEQSAISNFNAQRVTPEMLSESTKQLIEASGGGTITNLPDDEDLESVDDGTGSMVMKFRNKAYSVENFSGLGRVYLRKSISGDNNILTQEMISSPNTVYHIQYNYDLNGAEIIVPENSILLFEGGKISNGILHLNNCKTEGDESFSSVTLHGNTTNKKMKTYANVAELKADFAAIGKVQTLGYYEPNDGGGGIYEVKDEGIENGGTIHRLDNGLYAHLMFDGKTYKLKQWGISGKDEKRKVLDIYPFLSLSDVQKVNSAYTEETTAETYIIQYLIDNIRGSKTIYLDGIVYYINETIHLKSWISIIGNRTETDNQRSHSKGDYIYEDSILRMAKENISMFDTGSQVVQLMVLKNFNCVGVYGQPGFVTGLSSDSWIKLTSVVTMCTFSGLTISFFDQPINRNGQGIIWTRFDYCIFHHMRVNGLDMYFSNESYANTININYCKFYYCGCNIVGTYEDGYGIFEVKELDKPDVSQCNAIVLGGNGVNVNQTDVSFGYVGYFVAGYNNGCSIINSYTEGMRYSAIYYNYCSKLLPKTVDIVGGYYQSGFEEKFAYDTPENDAKYNNWEIYPYGGKVYVNNAHILVNDKGTITQMSENRFNFAFEVLNNDGYNIKVRIKKTSTLQYIIIGFINEKESKIANAVIDLTARTINSYLVNNEYSSTSHRAPVYTEYLNDIIRDVENNKLYIPKSIGQGRLAYAVEQGYTIYFPDGAIPFATLSLSDNDIYPDYYEVSNYNGASGSPTRICINKYGAYKQQFLFNFWEKTEGEEYDEYEFNINKLICNQWSGVAVCTLNLSQGSYEDVEFMNVKPAIPTITVPNTIMISNDVYSDDSGCKQIKTAYPIAVINNINSPYDDVWFFYQKQLFHILNGIAYTDDGYEFRYSLPENGVEGQKIYNDTDFKKYTFSSGEWIVE